MTGAADTMHLTQPAVSKLLAELERAVGFMVFERAKGRLVLTAAGRRFFNDVERTFLAIDQLHLSAASIRDHRDGHLSIGCQPALSTGFLATIMKDFLRERSGVTLSIYPLIAASLRDWIAQGLVDIAVGGLYIDNPAVTSDLIGSIEAVCILPPSHRACRKEIITPADLAGDSFISLNSQYLSSQYERNPYNIDAVFNAAGVRRNMRISTALAAVACAMVAQGLGVAIVAAVAAREYRNSGIVIKRFEPKIEFPVYAHYIAKTATTELAQDFVAAVRQALAGYAATSSS